MCLNNNNTLFFRKAIHFRQFQLLQTTNVKHHYHATYFTFTVTYQYFGLNLSNQFLNFVSYCLNDFPQHAFVDSQLVLYSLVHIFSFELCNVWQVPLFAKVRLSYKPGRLYSIHAIEQKNPISKRSLFESFLRLHKTMTIFRLFDDLIRKFAIM